MHIVVNQSVTNKFLLTNTFYYTRCGVSCIQVIRVFSEFVFEIRLIRLDFSFKKLKFLYLNSQPTDSQFFLTTTSQRPTVSGRHGKVFSSLQSCLTDSSYRPRSEASEGYVFTASVCSTRGEMTPSA